MLLFTDESLDLVGLARERPNLLELLTKAGSGKVAEGGAV
jgi:hypothetical protein